MAGKGTELEHNLTFGFEERFARCYPEGKIEVVRPEVIPALAKDLFEKRSRNLVHRDDHKKEDFYGYVKVSHYDGTVSWVAWRKPFLHNVSQWSFGLDMGVYCQDIDPKGNPIGWGEIAYWLTNRNTFFHDKPFLASSNTEKAFWRQGYDLRRVIMLNAISELFFDSPLYSSDHFLSQEDTGVRAHKRTWERLVREGVVKYFKDGSNDRYVFEHGRNAWQLLPGILERVKARRRS